MKHLLLASLLVALGTNALATEGRMADRADPWLPPAARVRSPEPPAAGPALQAQVLDKLRRRFEAADSSGYGSITREQARRAGLGAISAQFDQIDAARSGSISFEDWRRHLARRSLAQ